MIGKKSFVLYSDLKEVVDKLPAEDAGKLFKLILDYVNDEEPEPDGLLMEIAFEPIKQQLRRDLKKWEDIIGKRSKAGKLSSAQRGLMSTSVEQCATDSTDSVTVTVTDTVNWDKLIDVFNLIYGTNKKIISESIRKKYRARLKEGYTKKDIVASMKSAKKDDFHKNTIPPFKHLTIEFFSRPDKLDRFMDQTNSTKYIATK
tara:strand:+ start:1709 stop:2314 length:606 start_codon:yes stop_codon:yes gene_type:complete